MGKSAFTALKKKKKSILMFGVLVVYSTADNLGKNTSFI